MTTLNARNFVATDSDVADITKQYLGALTAQGAARSTYLKALIGTLQSEYTSDLPVYIRRSAPADLTSSQIKLLDQINTRFMATVMRTIADTPMEDEGRDKVKLRHRRAIFARSSASTLRSWIRAGHDVRALKPETASKRQLTLKRSAATIGSRTTTPAKQVVTLGERIVELAEEMASQDKAAASSTLEAVLSRLTQSLLDLGNKTTTKPEIAYRDVRPLKTPQGLFWPVVFHPENELIAETG